MPSTYSPNLRIELIANGEQSGTWGSTTNNNTGTLLENAISGYVEVPVTADEQALTALNGVNDQSRNMIVELTGTRAVAFKIFVPPAEKLYIFKNNTNQTATISASTVVNGTTATSGAKVDILAGYTSILFCDGVSPAYNIRLANDYIGGNLRVTGNLTVTGNETVSGSLTANSLSLTTALPVSSGGTGVASITAGSIPRGNGTLPLSPASGADVAAVLGSTFVQNANFATAATSATSATSATTATNIAGGAANRIPYNTGSGATSFLAAPTTGSQYLRYNGSTLEWGTLPSTGVLSVGTTAPLTNTGSAANPVIAIDSTTGVSAALGGTGQTSYTTGDLLYASGASTLSKLADVATGNALISGGVGTAPSWGKVGLTTHVSGTLPISSGGTGATTQATALTSLGAYPSTNPNGYTSNTGTVTAVATGSGLTGGTITSSGTISMVYATASTIGGVRVSVSGTTCNIITQ